MAHFKLPLGIAIDSVNQYAYVADTNNHTIRKITLSGPNPGTVTTLAGQVDIIGFVPGPLPGVIGIPYGLALIESSGSSELFIVAPNGIMQIKKR